MKLKDVVVIQNDKPVAGTWLIAQGFGREHGSICKLIEKYRIDFEDFGRLKRHQLVSTGGRPVVEYLLNKPQCLLLASQMRQAKKQIQFLTMLIQSFTDSEKSLKEILQALDAFDFDNINVRYVYAARDSLGRLKIGISNNPERRIKELNIGNPDKLSLVYTKETISPRYEDETKLHGKASQYHIRGEWFNPEAAQLLQ